MKAKTLFTLTWLGAACLPLATATAATLYWDGGTVNIGTNGDSASLGTAGTWDTTIMNWDAGAVPHVAWNNTNNDTAIFGGTAGTVTLWSAITAGALVFDTTGYTLNTGNSSILTLAGTSHSVTTANGVTATIAVILAGTDGLAKDGFGTLVLSGATANTFTGGLTVNAGTLSLDNANMGTPTDLINSGNSLTLGGGALSLLGATSGTTAQTLASLNVSGGANSIVINPNGGTSSTLTLTSTTVTRSIGATLNFNTSVGTPATAMVAWNPTLSNSIIGGGFTMTDSTGTGFATVTAGKVTRLTPGTVLTTTNPTAAATNFLTNTTGTLTNTVTAALLNSLTIDTTAGNNVWDLVNSKTATLSSGGLAMSGSNNFTIQNGTLKSNTATNSELIVNQWGTGTLTIQSVIANGIGASTLTKAGTGTLILSGSNTYSGATTIGAGTLALALTSGSSLADASALFIASGATVSAGTSVNETVSSLYLNGVRQVSGTWGSTSSSATNKNDTYFSGNGMLTATGIPMYWDGGTSDIAGTGNGASLGTAGTWNTTLKNWDMGAGQNYVAWNNTLNAADTATLRGTAATVTLGADISAGALVVKGGYTLTGAQTLTLNNTGTALSFPNGEHGTLTLGTSTIIKLGASQSWRPSNLYNYGGVGSTVTGGTVNLNGNNLTIERHYVDANNSGALAVKSLITGTGNLTIYGKTPIYNVLSQLNSANTYTGVTTIRAYTELTSALANGGNPSYFGNATSDPANLVFDNGGILFSALNSATNRGITLIGPDNHVGSGGGWGGATTLSGKITGSGSLAVAGTYGGSGTIVLTGDNDFTGRMYFYLVTGGAYLRLGSVNALAKATLDTTLGSTDLTTHNLAYVLGGLAGNVNLNLGTGAASGGSGKITVGNNDGTATYTGNLSGAAGLTKVGAGAQTLAGVNSYGGPTTVSAGKLVFATGSNLSTSDFSVATNATLGVQVMTSGGQVTAKSLTLGSISTTPTTEFNFTAGGVTTTAPLQINGNVINNGTLNATIVGGGFADSTDYPLIKYTGTLTVGTLGTVTMGNGATATLVDNPGNKSIDLHVITGNQIVWNGGNDYWNIDDSLNWQGDLPYLQLTAPGSAVLFDDTCLGDGPYEVHIDGPGPVSPSFVTVNNPTKDYTIFGVITGATGLLKSGAASLTLSGINTYTGATTITNGSLSYGTANALGTGTVTVNGAGATLDLVNFTDTVGTVTLAGGGQITGTSGILTSTGTLEMMSGSANVILGGTSIPLNKTTTGTVTLSKANTYTGTTTITDGTLAYGITNALAAGAVTVNGAAAILDIASYSDTVGAVTLTNGTISGTSGVLTGSSYTLSAGSISAKLGGAIGITKNTTATVTLTGASTFNGTTTIEQGTLSVASLDYVTAGTYPAVHLTGSSLGAPTDSAKGTITFGVDTSPAGGQTTNLTYTGSGETTDRILRLATRNGSVTLDQSGAGNLKFTTNLTILGSAGMNTSKTIILQGSTAGTGEINGIIPNGAIPGNGNTTSISKLGTGTWTLSGPNTYTGTTTVGGGVLAITGANAYTGNTIISGGQLTLSGAGTINLSASISALATGATLYLDNTTNNGNRLKDLGTVFMTGGTLNFYNPAATGIAYSESTGALTISSGNNTITSSQAASDGSSTLSFTGITRTAGAFVNFTGTGLGTNNQNRIMIGGLADGAYLGNWATINTTDLAYYSTTYGVMSGTYTDIATLGSTIFDGASTNVRINSLGSGSNIVLSASPATVNTLTQAYPSPATVATALQIFRTSSVRILNGQSALTIGAAANDGSLSAATVGGELALMNYSTSPLLINAAITNNSITSTTACSLMVTGGGTVTLAGNNTFTGVTNVYAGKLVVATSANLPGAIIAAGATCEIDNGSGASSFGVTNSTGIQGAGTFNKRGSGTLSLLSGTAGNTITGQVNLYEGITQTSSNFRFNDGTSSVGLFIDAGASFNWNSSQSQTFNGVLSGTGTFFWNVASEPKVLQLNGVNTFNGMITFGRNGVAATSLTIGGAGVLGNGNYSGTINFSGAFGHTATLNYNSSANQTFSGIIGDTPGTKTFVLVKNGTGVLTLSGTHTYSGATTITAGKIIVANGTGIGDASAVSLANAATASLQLDNHETIGTLAGGGLSGGSVNLQANTLTVGTAAGVTSYDGVLSGTGGGLTKVLAGTQTLTGINTYTGQTTVAGGTLALSTAGSIANSTTVEVQSPAILNVSAVTGGTWALGAAQTLQGTGNVTGTTNAAGVISPGLAGTGTLSHTGNLALTGTYTCQVNGLNCDLLAVTGTLSLTGATLNVTGTLDQESYVIATYTTGSAPAFTFKNVPSNYTVDYATAGQVKLLKGGSAYDQWALAKGLTEGNKAMNLDPDKDGVKNILEFALGGNPLSGSDNGILVSKVQNVEGVPTLTLTIATRTATSFPAGTGARNANNTAQGIQYRIEGGQNLGTWLSDITEITPAITTGLPDPAPAGYEYHTFKTAGPVSTTPADFMRLKVSE